MSKYILKHRKDDVLKRKGFKDFGVLNKYLSDNGYELTDYSFNNHIEDRNKPLPTLIFKNQENGKEAYVILMEN